MLFRPIPVFAVIIKVLIRKIDIKYAFQTPAFLYLSLSEKPCSMTASDGISSLP